jgi:hypothetical protein
VLTSLVVLIAGSAEASHAADDGSLSVFAAASLTASFRAVATAFESTHPGTKVALNFAGSPTLVQQIREGAPADVFASADEANMQKLVDAGAVAGSPQVRAEPAVDRGRQGQPASHRRPRRPRDTRPDRRPLRRERAVRPLLPLEASRKRA